MFVVRKPSLDGNTEGFSLEVADKKDWFLTREADSFKVGQLEKTDVFGEFK